MTAQTLEKLQVMSVSLLELLKTNLPEKSGEVNAWKFEKAHSILHKVRELILFGWSENFSTQGPEHCHIDFCKKVAACTNNKDVFLCILRHHVREGHLQYLQKLQADLACEDDSEAVPHANSPEDWLARNDSISCELGIRYPVLQAILSGRKNHQSLMVRAYETGCNSEIEIISYTISYTMSYTILYIIQSYTMSYTISYTISYTTNFALTISLHADQYLFCVVGRQWADGVAEGKISIFIC